MTEFDELEPNQRELAKALEVVAPGIGEAYHGAIRVLQLDYPERVHQAACSLRAIVEVMFPVEEAEDEQVKVACPQCGTRFTTDRVPEKKRDREKAIKLGLDRMDPAGSAMPTTLRKEYAGRWRNIHRRLSGVVHRGSDEEAPTVSSLMMDLERLLREWLIPETQSDYMRIESLIEEGANVGPNSVISELHSLAMRRTANYIHFFRRLDSHIWLEMLQEKGFFKEPPEMGPWPASQYLTRISSSVSDHQALRRILLNISTNNPLVIRELSEVYLETPVGIAGQVRWRAEEWLTHCSSDPVLLENLSKMIGKLAAGGRDKPALKLAEMVFEIETQKGHVGASPERLSPRELKAVHFKGSASYFYEKYLPSCIPPLVQASGLEAVKWITRLLERAMVFLEGKCPKRSFSYIWRNTVEQRRYERHGTILDAVVDAAGEGVEAYLKANPEGVDDVWELLARYEHPFFRRLELHLMRECPDLLAERIPKKLLTFELFKDDNALHEYTLLLRDSFKGLSPHEQDQILEWMEGEHLRPQAEEDAKKSGGQLDAPELLRRYQWQRLAAISKHLDEKWADRYARLEKEFGEPKDPTFMRGPEGGFFTPASPKSSDDILAMDVSKFAEFLGTWQYEGSRMDFEAPCPEGLALSLNEAVAAEPGRFAEHANEFAEQRPVYVCAFLRGLITALRSERAFGWLPVLELCKWAASQIKEDKGSTSDILSGLARWRDCRIASARLLDEGLQIRTNGIPYEYGKNVWVAIEALAQDTHPKGKFDDECGNDPLTHSINSVRGNGMHCVMRFISWCKDHADEGAAEGEQPWKGLDSVPEAKSVLQDRLDPRIDPSLAIRSVYGQWFPQLFRFDPAWAEANREKIFPLSESEEHYFLAAWRAYLFPGSFDPDVVGLLKPQYELAISNLAQESTETDANRRMTQHVAFMYARGDLKESPNEDLLGSFWMKARPELRSEVFSSIGEGLRSLKEVDAQVLGRLRKLLEYRIEYLESAEPSEGRELEPYGEWFLSGKLAGDYALEKLVLVLERTRGGISSRREVLQDLSELAESKPLEVVRCMEQLFHEDLGWEIWYGEGEARETLEKILSSPHEDAIQRAIRLRDGTMARGVMIFEGCK